MGKPVIVHAHALWFMPRGLDRVGLAMSMCGTRDLVPSKGEVTADLKVVTCKVCLARVAKAKEVAKAPPPAPVPTKKIITAVVNGSGAKAAEWTWPAGARLHLLTKQNPCKQGTAKHARWAIVFAHHDKTVQDYRDAKGNPETLRNALRDKIVEIKGEGQ